MQLYSSGLNTMLFLPSLPLLRLFLLPAHFIWSLLLSPRSLCVDIISRKLTLPFPHCSSWIEPLWLISAPQAYGACLWLVICFSHWTVSSLDTGMTPYFSLPFTHSCSFLPNICGMTVWLARYLIEHRIFPRTLTTRASHRGGVCKGRGIDCTKSSEHRTLPWGWKQQLLRIQLWSEREHLLSSHTRGLG